MKDCRDIRDLLSPFLAGEVAEEEKSAIETHLEGCSDCRSDLALLRQTVAALRSVPDLPPPAAILHGVRKEISPAPAKGFFRRFFGEGAWVGVPIGALAMAVLGIAAFVLQDRYPELPEGSDVAAPRQTVTSAVEKKADETVKELITAPPATEEPAGELRQMTEGERSPAAPSPAAAPVGRQVPVDTPVADEKAGDPRFFADDKAERAAAPAAPREDISRRRAPEPPAERPAISSEAAPIVEGSDYDHGAAKDTVARRPVVPPAPPAMPSPPAAAAPGDTYRSGEGSSGMKDVRRLLESSELLTPGRRENGRAPFPAVDDAPSGPGVRRGSEAMVADRDGADETRPARVEQAVEPEMKKSVKRRARVEAPPAAALRVEDSLQGAAAGKDSRGRIEEFTEVLTLLSLRGDDMTPLRQSIGKAGGQLLELKSLDPSESRDLARPFADDIPSGQTISRGWRIRALLPAGKVAGFIRLIEDEAQLRVLDRTRTPAARQPAPGIQTLEIKVVQ